MVKAVDKVESRGAGFLASGEPKILFEPHVFGRLTGYQYNKSHPDISKAKWDPNGYGPAGMHQHKKLQRAAALDRQAALQSTSWGRFQVMGFNWQLVGRRSLQDFVNAQYRGENEHLRDFVNYVIARGLRDEMQREDCVGFAFGYNGEGYKVHHYDTKIATALKSFRGE